MACYLGNLKILKILDEDFNADFKEETPILGLTGLHCASINENGIVSIHYLAEKYQ